MLPDVNAVTHMTRSLPADALRRLAALRVRRFDRSPAIRSVGGDAATRVAARWSADLCGLLNAMTREELVVLARALRVTRSGEATLATSAAAIDHEDGCVGDARAAELRVALWERGAALERHGMEVSRGLQPRPVVLGGHLVVQAPPRGMAPHAASYPRPLPAPVHATPPSEEPETLDDLLAAADRAIGVRLGPRGRDKGAWGIRAAELLGIIERGHEEPDWRGDVEVKTVPVAREASGHWSIVEDPAIAMSDALGAGAIAKLQRTLWLARATVDDTSKARVADATIVSWYLLDWDADVARLAKRYLHERPKGPRNTKQRGLYLAKRFFADAGLLATLNGHE